ncbi:hypothetical protein [Floridanema evergladense]|uniref:Uncharacterized protein n=1 Tax=Floridaenema evergladense BLCC-F167 TaxID=3153639 RepID=A0ABV4WQ27_9CYAN
MEKICDLQFTFYFVLGDKFFTGSSIWDYSTDRSDFYHLSINFAIAFLGLVHQKIINAIV